MSLFQRNDVPDPEVVLPVSAKAKSVSLKAKGAEINSLTAVRETIGQIAEGETVPYFSKGAWSNVDLLEFILTDFSGPSEVWISTWGIGEETFRQIFHLIDIGLITGLNCLFDHRISQQKAKELQLVKGMANKIAFKKNHSKVMAIKGLDDSKLFSVYTSANFTKNPRMEAGVIFRSKTVTEFTYGFIEREIESD